MREFQTLLVRPENHCIHLLLNRPGRLNAVTAEMYQELEEALDQIAGESSFRTVILGGMGRAFCAGADLKEHRSARRSPQEMRSYAEAARRVCAKLQGIQKPVICSVRGYALGAGAEMALSCDFVLMDRDARIGFPEVSIGTYVGGGLSYLLPHLVGLARARELLFLGKRITGGEAERIGLIYRATDGDDLDEESISLGESLSAVAPIPFAIAKNHLREHRMTAPDAAMGLEVDALLRCMETDDWKEGIEAFNEKRQPRFRGR